MADTRILRARALVDDARTVLAEMAEEINNDALEAARFSLNAALGHLSVLGRQL